MYITVVYTSLTDFYSDVRGFFRYLPEKRSNSTTLGSYHLPTLIKILSLNVSLNFLVHVYDRVRQLCQNVRRVLQLYQRSCCFHCVYTG